MEVRKKNVRRISLGVTAQSVMDSFELENGDAVPALQEAIQDQGGVDELLALLDRVETAAAKVGGVERLRDCLEALKKIAA